MLTTELGVFDGASWEALCQNIFKFKYREAGYQNMPASPGDYGIEGFIREAGIAFQCYCPDGNYTQAELYEKQRDKITNDIGKLDIYRKELAARLGDNKIKKWLFITPEFNHNKLIEHARKKEAELKKLNLPFIDEAFQILIHDAAYYATEINHFREMVGERITVQDAPPVLTPIDPDASIYESNIDRKNRKRVFGENIDEKLRRINGITLSKLLAGEALLKKIENVAPRVHYNLARVISQYEDEVSELCLTWRGEPEELIERVRGGLIERIQEEAGMLGSTEIRKVADNLISKWIAICTLDFMD